MYGVAWQYYGRPAALISVRQGIASSHPPKVPKVPRSQGPRSPTVLSTFYFLLPTSHSHLCTQTLFSLFLHSVVHGPGDRYCTDCTVFICLYFPLFPSSQAFNQIACLQSELFLHSALQPVQPVTHYSLYWTTGLLDYWNILTTLSLN